MHKFGHNLHRQTDILGQTDRQIDRLRLSILGLIRKE